MSKYDELKRLAEAANAIVGDVDFHFTIARAGGCDQAEVDAVAAFLGKANPHAILELITENERLVELVDDYKQGAKAEADGGDAARAEARLLRSEVEALRKDKARLDSGCIITRERDEWGERNCERRGLDLRACIDAAMKEASL